MTTYHKDRQIEYNFTKIIKGILGNQFITQDIKLDKEEGTDFTTFQVNPFRIAVRLRRYKMFLQYPNDFTIRWSRPLGIKTEIHKIMEGLVDYILYGFINQEETKIIQYFIGDLNIFRQLNSTPITIIPNNPRDSDLAVYKLTQFPHNFIIKYYHE